MSRGALKLAVTHGNPPGSVNNQIQLCNIAAIMQIFNILIKLAGGGGGCPYISATDSSL